MHFEQRNVNIDSYERQAYRLTKSQRVLPSRVAVESNPKQTDTEHHVDEEDSRS